MGFLYVLSWEEIMVLDVCGVIPSPSFREFQSQENLMKEMEKINLLIKNSLSLVKQTCFLSALALLAVGMFFQPVHAVGLIVAAGLNPA